MDTHYVYYVPLLEYADMQIFYPCEVRALVVCIRLLVLVLASSTGCIFTHIKIPSEALSVVMHGLVLAMHSTYELVV